MLINNSRVKRDSKQLSEDTDSGAVGLTYDAPSAEQKCSKFQVIEKQGEARYIVPLQVPTDKTK